MVVRRYNDFLWFHDQLRIHNKGVLIPPLPEKALISMSLSIFSSLPLSSLSLLPISLSNAQLDRFSTEFIETRRKELEKFLNRVVQHHILHRRPEVIFFLESSDDQFNAAKSRTPKPAPSKRAEKNRGWGNVRERWVEVAGEILTSYNRRGRAGSSAATE